MGSNLRNKDSEVQKCGGNPEDSLKHSPVHRFFFLKYVIINTQELSNPTLQALPCLNICKISPFKADSPTHYWVRPELEA